ncbi:hypothetical protein PGT21_023520 [Puccinia graminis f. sp. tritici]|uniref:Uncharacterized protein n=1 Tax=Puccinia graminis f. sp. tritici TaxID=56615 RepID=A0A5B0QXZ3_PUCGR|nr:hypothetical protein PGT21_023520 [Puccinia graminis f. sp. tritici]
MSVLFSAQNPELHSKFSGDLFTIYKILDETILIACYFNLFTHVGKFPSRIMSHVHCYKRGNLQVDFPIFPQSSLGQDVTPL